MNHALTQQFNDFLSAQDIQILLHIYYIRLVQHLYKILSDHIYLNRLVLLDVS
jgi:hypothetical protein